MPEARTYPHGVTCWVDAAQPDVDAATRFYGGLFGWGFEDAAPPEAPVRYVIASLGGRDVAALTDSADGSATWNTYVAVDDCAAAAATLQGLGATVTAPADAGPEGQAGRVSDLGVRETLEVRHGDRLALLDGKFGDGGPDRFAVERRGHL